MDFRSIESYLTQAVQENMIPGAVLRIEQAGSLLYEQAIGLRHTAPERPMQTDTLFDLASLTKVTATLGVMLTLFEKGILTPDKTLGELLAVSEDKKQITLEQCLTHSAGFPSSIALQKDVMEINQLKLQYEPGSDVIYSDVGFLLLGKVIEKATGQTLDQAVSEHAAAWGMPDTTYNPADKERCAATEWRDYLGRYQLGEVHDENATVLGGVAGHAGLFSTAKDLAVYGQMYLSGQAGEWFHRSWKCYTEGLSSRRGLGWLLAQPGCFGNEDPISNSFGHTGFTGTSIWIDPDLQLVIILLTNRVHFGRHPHILQIRSDVHRMIYEVVYEKSGVCEK